VLLLSSTGVVATRPGIEDNSRSNLGLINKEAGLLIDPYLMYDYVDDVHRSITITIKLAKRA
jgi:hypothetical protein